MSDRWKLSNESSWTPSVSLHLLAFCNGLAASKRRPAAEGRPVVERRPALETTVAALVKVGQTSVYRTSCPLKPSEDEWLSRNVVWTQDDGGQSGRWTEWRVTKSVCRIPCTGIAESEVASEKYIRLPQLQTQTSPQQQQMWPRLYAQYNRTLLLITASKYQPRNASRC